MVPTLIKLFIFALYAINLVQLVTVNLFQTVPHVLLDFSKIQQLECVQVNVLSDILEALFKDYVNPVIQLVNHVMLLKVLTV
jgi:hypothetical protein